MKRAIVDVHGPSRSRRLASAVRAEDPHSAAVAADGRSLYVNEIASTDGDPNDLAPMVVRRIVL